MNNSGYYYKISWFPSQTFSAQYAYRSRYMKVHGELLRNIIENYIQVGEILPYYCPKFYFFWRLLPQIM